MKKLKLHHWILIGMALGAALGIPLNMMGEAGEIDSETVAQIAHLGHELGDIFLRLLKMLVVPLIVSSLVTGIMGLGDLRQLGRLGSRTIAYYLFTSALAITVGIIMVNLINPGVGVDISLLQPEGGSGSGPSVVEGDSSVWAIVWRQISGMIPTNPIAAAAEGKMLPIIFFSLILAVFMNLTGGEHGKRLGELFASLFQVMMKMTMAVIQLAPIGVFGFMLHATAGSGIEAFRALFAYMLTVALALLIHAGVTLPLLLIVLAKRNPITFMQAMGPALLTAFSTASSNATLPLTMNCVEERAGVPNRVSSFVLPLGATINMDGTALYEAVAVLFIAQASGADLDLAQQIIVAFTALLASVGAAGIPHAGTVMMVVVLNAVGLPASAVGLILAVDRVLDMCRTTVNVWSDSAAAATVARLVEAEEPSAESAPS